MPQKGAPAITDEQIAESRRRAEAADAWLSEHPMAWRTFERVACMLTEGGRYVRLNKVAARCRMAGVDIPREHLQWCLAVFAASHPAPARLINPHRDSLTLLASQWAD